MRLPSYCFCFTSALVVAITHARRWHLTPKSGNLIARRYRSQLGAMTGLRGGSSNSAEEAQYSFSLTTFSPRGSLSQIEYAMNSVAVGALALAIKYDRGVVLASVSKAKSPLVRDVTTKKITQVTDRVAIIYAGLGADSRVLTSQAQKSCLQYSEKFGENSRMPISVLVSDVASVMQEYTQRAGVRPFGVTLLVAGVEAPGDPSDVHDSDIEGNAESGSESVHLYCIDPSGRYSPWKAMAIGKGSSDASILLEQQFRENMDRNEAVELAISVSLSCAEGNATRDDVDMLLIEGRA